MPLGKNDNPQNLKATEADGSPKEVSTLSGAETHEALNEVADAGAGAPPEQRDAAEDLPERNEVQKAIKAGMLADDAQTEAKEKAKVVKLSPDSPETPSGGALLATAGISDDIKRGEEYSRIKSAIRHGYVPATEDDLKAKK
jgi:hypothetical protein